MILQQWCAVRGKEYLLEQWHPTKNGKLTPDTVTNSSGKQVWWRCENGHEWRTQVKTRANSSTGCPYCREAQLRLKRTPEMAAELPPETGADEGLRDTAVIAAEEGLVETGMAINAAVSEEAPLPAAPESPEPADAGPEDAAPAGAQPPASAGMEEVPPDPIPEEEAPAPAEAALPVSEPARTPAKPAVPAGPRAAAPKPRYLGSVRFFKNLILLAVLILIAVPTTISIRCGAQLNAVGTQLESVQAQLAEMSAPPSEAESGEEEPVEGETLSADTPSYQALYPELYAGEAARSSVSTDKTAYLTFDDGPSARTPEILAILERYNIKATFFVVGHGDEQSQQWMRDIVAAGHTLGVHSYCHKYQQIYASVEDYLEDFNLMYTQIVEVTGVKPQVFRFPGGSINGYNGSTWREIIAEMVRRGFVYFDWNVSNDDSVQSGVVSAAALTQNCLARVGQLNRAVILMHDSEPKTTTVQALPAIIEGYQNAGFTFEPLTAEVKPVIYGYPG